VCDGLEIGRALGRVLAGLEPVSDRLFDQSGFREMVCQSFRLGLRNLSELMLERVRDGGVQMRAAAFQEAGICGVPYQRVLEGVNRVWVLASAENQFRPHQLRKRIFQSLPRQSGDGVQQFVMEFATRDGADLCHLPDRRQPIKTRHQRRVQRCRDRQSRQRTFENILAIPFPQQSAFQHRLGQLLDEQRHAIGARKDLVRYLLRQRLASRHPLDQCRARASAKARERDRRYM